MTSDPVYDKLAFNGFHVRFYNHESTQIETQSFPTVESVYARKFETIPTVEDFVEDLFDVFGDVVGEVKDNSGVVLYDNIKEMIRIQDLMTY